MTITMARRAIAAADRHVESAIDVTLEYFYRTDVGLLQDAYTHTRCDNGKV